MRPYGAIQMTAATATQLAQIGGNAAQQSSLVLKDPRARDASKTVGAMLTTGAAAAAIPGVGWVAAAGLGAGAGIITLVGALRGGGMRKQEAAALAAQLGIPDAANVPGFTVRALRLAEQNPQKLYKLGQRYERQLMDKQRGGFKLKPALWFRSESRIAAKLAVIGGVLAYYAAERQRRIPSAQSGGALQVDPQLYLAAGGVMLLAMVLLARRR